MKREWRPGDVALLQVGTASERIGLRCTVGWRTVAGLMSDDTTPPDAVHRPLLVIDPEDREQVERIANAFCSIPSSGWSDAMQAALRSLLAPPKHPEPERLAALVEDANGVKYVSVADPLDGWMARRRWLRIGGEINATLNFGWSELDVVRVLSDGWGEES